MNHNIMKHLKPFELFINEAKVNTQVAMDKVNSLPKGKMFDDARKIDTVFKRSSHTWSEVIETFEKNQSDASIKTVNIKDIQITQPNIQAHKIENMLKDFGKLPLINVVEFPDGLAIYDGHHRLIAAWAMGEKKIKVNLVKV